MNIFFRLLGAILIGGSFLLIGYKIYIGDPIVANIAYGGISFMDVQKWLIQNIGGQIVGLTFMFTGFYAVLWSVFTNRTTLKMKLVGYISAGFGAVVIYYGHQMYNGNSIDLGEAHGRRQGLQNIFKGLIESIQESLGMQNAGLLFAALGVIWFLLSIKAGIFLREKHKAD